MTLEQFQWNANSRGLRVVDNVAMGDYYGQYSVFPFSISGSGKENNVFILDIRTEKVINNSLCKQLRKQLKQMGSVMNTVLPGIRFVPNNKTLDLFGACLSALNIIVPVLEANGHVAPCTCPYCKNGMMDSEAYVNGFLVPVHRACVEKDSFQNLEKIQKNETTGSNRFTGIIGAILGALVGSIPALLLLIFMNMVSAWLYALVPICSYYGYKLLKGKMDKWVLPIVIICTLIMPFIVEQIQFYFLVHDYYHVWPLPHETVSYYFEVVSIGEMFQDIALPLLFSVIGILISLGITRQTNATAQKGIDFTLRTLFVRNQPQQHEE